MLKYSVDKIKLEFLYVKTERIQSFLNGFSYSLASDNYYTSNAMAKCKHNFLIGDSVEGRIYLGIEPNWRKQDKHCKSIILEYNPNKVNPFFLSELLWLKDYPVACIKVLSFDIAVDMAIDYRSVRMLKRDTREKFCKIGKRYLETFYLGQLGHNHVKLYNKAVEQKMDNVNWTRFEITIKEINSLSCTLKEFEDVVSLPKLFYIRQQVDIEYIQMDDITRIVLDSIISDIEVLYTIKNYRTRKRYESLLYEIMGSIDITVKDMYNAYLDFTRSIFTDSCYDFVDVNEIMYSQCGI